MLFPLLSIFFEKTFFPFISYTFIVLIKKLYGTSINKPLLIEEGLGYTLKSNDFFEDLLKSLSLLRN